MSELAGVWLISAVLTAVALLFQPVNPDEAWFLLAARRVARGERLYRDVFYGAGPSAIWLLALAFLLLRPQLVVLRTLTVGYTASLATASAGLVWTLGATPSQGAAVALAALAFGGRQLDLDNHYGLLSNVASLLAFAAALNDQIVLAGLLLALSSTSRYPTGIAATVALAGVLFYHSSAREIGILLVTWGCALLLVLLLLRPEGVRWLTRRAIRNKGVYLRTGSIGPLAGIRTTLAMWDREPLSIALVSLVAHGLLPVAVGAAFWALLAGTVRLAAVYATSLALLAAFASLPRSDAPHVVAVAPLAVASLGASCIALNTPRAVWWSVVLISAWSLVSSLASRVRQLRHVQHRRNLPSLRGFPVLSSGAQWPDETEELTAIAGHSVLLLDPHAPFFYVSGSLQNPTPFDYPFASTFGPRGQAEVIQAIEAGSVSWVWIGREIPDPFPPVELLSFVEQRMELVARVCGGELYRPPRISARQARNTTHAKIDSTTSPCTSVRRKSRPW